VPLKVEESQPEKVRISHSQLLVVELLMDPNRSDKLVYAVDLQMPVALVGRKDTTAQFQALYDAARLRLTRIIPAASISSS
jgi:hypothetical protein